MVTEGAEDSGALITAEDGFANNRKVFAVPGPITFHLSKGSYRLIAKGAILVTDIKEILESFAIPPVERKIKKLRGDSPEEQQVLDLLENESLHFDEIVRKTGIDSSKIGALLSLVEMKGLIKSLELGIFSIAS